MNLKECGRIRLCPTLRDYLEILLKELRRRTESFRIIMFGLGIEAHNFVSHSVRKSKQTARDSTVLCELGSLN
jgi:hypothetical protein